MSSGGLLEEKNIPISGGVLLWLSLMLWVAAVGGLLIKKLFFALESATELDDLLRQISLSDFGDFVAGVVSIPLLIYAIRAFLLQRNELSLAVAALRSQSDQLMAQSLALQSQTQVLRDQLSLQTRRESLKSMPEIVAAIVPGNHDKYLVEVSFSGYDVRDVFIDVIRPGRRHGNGYPVIESGASALGSIGYSKYDSAPDVASPVFVRLSFLTLSGSQVERLYVAWKWGDKLHRVKEFSDEEISEKIKWNLINVYGVDSKLVRLQPWT